MMRLKRLFGIVLLLALSALVGAADVKNTDSMGRDYFLYAPARIDKAKTYWLVVGVHGYGGRGEGAAGLADWAQKGDCIVVGPSFPNEGYQLLEKQAAEQLEKLFAELRKKFTLHPRMFLYGFSGGAQFAHRFMMKNPELVAGCAAHSGGSWATGSGWGEINAKAADVPLVISCGQNDVAKMHANAPFGRLEWCRNFEKLLAEKDFLFDAAYWPGVGHQNTPGAQKMTLECYALATQQLPEAYRARETISRSIEEGKLSLAIPAIARARTQAPNIAGAVVHKAARRHNAQLDLLLGRIEEIGLAKVKAIAETPVDRQKAMVELRQVLADFRGAPRTTAAAQKALKELPAARPLGQ